MATTKTHIVTTPSKRGSSNGDVTSPKSGAPTSSPAKSTGGDVTTKGVGGGVADGVSLKATMTEFSGKGSVAVNGDADEGDEMIRFLEP
nr:amino acid/polyamine transporter I [Tanacetum cinerariifolium]